MAPSMPDLIALPVPGPATTRAPIKKATPTTTRGTPRTSALVRPESASWPHVPVRLGRRTGLADPNHGGPKAQLPVGRQSPAWASGRMVRERDIEERRRIRTKSGKDGKGSYKDVV
jgi:hypothetical protein